MPNPQNIVKHKMKKGQTLNPNGRPPKLVTHINTELRSQGFEPASKSNIVDAYLTLLNLPMSKIAAIASSRNVFYKEGDKIIFLSEGDEYPILYRLVAKELINDKRGAEYLEKMLDRAIGKPTQPLSGDSENPLFPNLDKLTSKELNQLRALKEKTK